MTQKPDSSWTETNLVWPVTRTQLLGQASKFQADIESKTGLATKFQITAEKVGTWRHMPLSFERWRSGDKVLLSTDDPGQLTRQYMKQADKVTLNVLPAAGTTAEPLASIVFHADEPRRLDYKLTV
jgi:hypothetical protein